MKIRPTAIKTESHKPVKKRPRPCSINPGRCDRPTIRRPITPGREQPQEPYRPQLPLERPPQPEIPHEPPRRPGDGVAEVNYKIN